MGDLCSASCSYCGRCSSADAAAYPDRIVVCQDCQENFQLPADEQGSVCDTCLDLRGIRQRAVNEAAIVETYRRAMRDDFKVVGRPVV